MWGFRRDVRPPRLPLQRTIPSFSAMVFSCPAGAFFHGKRMLKQHSWQKDAEAAARQQAAAAAVASKSWNISADPGRRKGERVREKDVLHQQQQSKLDSIGLDD